IDNQSFTVVGVAPPAFRGTVMGLQFDLWVPLSLQPQLVPGGDRLEDRGNRWLDVLARLKPGATRERAQAELDAIGARPMRDFPATNEGRRLAACELWRSPEGAPPVLMPVFSLLAVAASFVLIVTCANVAGLLLARGAGRGREIAMRVALGA